MRISISSHHFSLREPYTEGSVLSAVEAQALNRLRAENIRNNMAKIFARSRPKTPSQLEAFQNLLTEYDLTYRFADRVVSPPSSLEIELEKMAQDEIEIEIREKGLILGRAQYEELLRLKMNDPSFVSKGKARLKAKQELALKALDELFDEAAA